MSKMATFCQGGLLITYITSSAMLRSSDQSPSSSFPAMNAHSIHNVFFYRSPSIIFIRFFRLFSLMLRVQEELFRYLPSTSTERWHISDRQRYTFNKSMPPPSPRSGIDVCQAAETERHERKSSKPMRGHCSVSQSITDFGLID